VTFPLAFAAHDLEEVLTAARWSENAAARLTRRHPRLGRALAAALPISTKEMAIAVGVVAAGVGGVTAASLRNLDGDLRLFQAALAAFSAHSLGHVGASVVFRGHTPGIATVPTVIVPYSLWAWRRPPCRHLHDANRRVPRRASRRRLGRGSCTSRPRSRAGDDRVRVSPETLSSDLPSRRA